MPVFNVADILTIVKKESLAIGSVLEAIGCLPVMFLAICLVENRKC
jgi:hypothetical protein